MNTAAPTHVTSPYPTSASAMAAPGSTATVGSVGGRLIDAQGRELPLVGSHLEAVARGGIARTVLEQTFRNVHDEPLLVTYKLPLPATGAVSGFRFRIGERLVVGEVDRRETARQRFEDAMAAGQTAALLEQTRTDTFEQSVGNIPAGAEVRCEIEVDQRLDWLAEGAWEWRFPTVVGPRYLGAPGRVADAGALTTDYVEGDTGVRATLALRVGDALPRGAGVRSPSHALAVDAVGSEHEVRLAGEGAALDRDVVVRWSVATPEVGAALQIARPASERHDEGRAFGLLTVVPPLAAAAMKPVARDLIFLLDISGSMGGPPLEQAKRVVCAMIDSLCAEDRLELIAFSSVAKRWKREAAVATRDGKAAAIKWVRSLSASGGTEMRDALYEALDPLRRDAQRQVVLVTDGYIGFENEIVQTVLERLPARSRLHTIGVGSAPNRALTGPAARGGRGVEAIVGLDEDVEPAAKRLLERTVAPLVTELRVEAASGDFDVEVVPARLPDLYAGCPALLAVAVPAQGGRLRVSGTTAAGPWSYEVEAPALALGAGNPAIATLFGRERVEDLEMFRTCASDSARRGELDGEVEELGLRYQIATRLTSWVAIDEEAHVAAGTPQRREEMPHQLPYGTSVGGLGLRAAVAASPYGGGAVTATFAALAEPFALGAPPPPPQMAFPAPAAPKGAMKRARKLESPVADEAAPLRESRTEPPAAPPGRAGGALPEKPSEAPTPLVEPAASPIGEADPDADADDASAVWPWIVLALAAIAFLLWLLF
jgi:Ca-activated chloride channel family protein